MRSIIDNSRTVQSPIIWISLSVSSAVLLNLSFPNPGVSILAWIALIPFYLVLMTGSLKRAVVGGIITGFFFNIIYLFWVKEYKHPASLPGAVIGEMGYFLIAVILSWFLYHHAPFRELALPLGWLSIDYLKTVGYLAFPWGILGYSQYSNLFIIQSASIFGVWGISFIIYYFNATAALLAADIIAKKSRRRSAVNGAVVCGLILLSVFFGFQKLKETQPELQTKRIALIQPNFDPWSPDIEGNIMSEVNLTQRALEADPDLIVWSESSVPFLFDFYLRQNYKYAHLVHNYFTSIRRPVLFGTTEFVGEYREGEFYGDFYNVAVYYNIGKKQGVYRKIHLVPFGEWFPYKKLFPWVARILEEAGAGDFRPGTEYSVFKCDGLKFSALVCYEDVFGNLAREFVRKGSRLLVNVTNDAWTNSPKFEQQHFSISVFRSIENRVSLARCANGGVTACVDPYGRVIGRLPIFTADLLVCDVPVSEDGQLTFYSRHGDLLPWLIIAAVFALVSFSAVKKLIDTMRNKNNM
jgi:apolipoprotein N-acyltransferase